MYAVQSYALRWYAQRTAVDVAFAVSDFLPGELEHAD